MIDGNFEIITAAVTDRGLSDKRPQNEDSFLSLPDHGIYAVADGVGGAMAGDVASQMAVEILGEAFINYSATADPEEIMTVAIDRANTAINQMASELSQLASMATTIVALHVSGNIATVAHVGDSRAYRLDVDGHLFRETQDHSVVEEEVRAGRMTPEQAANHPSRNVISRAVGAETTVDIDIKTIILEPGTTFLLCSDGITRHIPDQEIAELLTSGISVADLCERMKDICYSRGAEDNLTAVLVKVAEVAQRAAETPGAAVVDDLEEETIATARSPFENYADESEAVDLAVDLNSTPQVIPEENKESDDEAYLIEQDLGLLDSSRTDAEVLTSEYESSRVIVPAAVSPGSPHDNKEFSMSGDSSPDKAEHYVKPVSAGNSLLRSLLFLLLGGLVGAAGVYFWFQSRPEPTPIVSVNNLEPKSLNVPSTAFEESREIVDRDPDAYVESNVASTQNTEDHYFLGRALFLSGKHFEAKRQFTLAEERIADTDPKKAVTIRADIAMMSAVIEDAQAAEAFKRNFEIIRQKNPGIVSPSNSNSNAFSNANAVR